MSLQIYDYYLNGVGKMGEKLRKKLIQFILAVLSKIFYTDRTFPIF